MKLILALFVMVFVASGINAQNAPVKEAKKDMKEAAKDMKEAKKDMKEAKTDAKKPH